MWPNNGKMVSAEIIKTESLALVIPADAWFWPTAMASDMGSGYVLARGNWGLSMAVQEYPIGIPDTHHIYKSKSKTERTIRKLPVGPKLNPKWVEWLMGFLSDWTE